jgi:PA14 domain-containing protein
VTAWVVRAIFIAVMPAAFSIDAAHWYEVAQALARGQNPYSTTYHLNWPPLWMQVVGTIGWFSAATELPFQRLLQFTLILFESATMAALFGLLKRVAPAANARVALLVGISLNPIAILLICQHGNFDVLVALWIVLFMTRVIAFEQSADGTDWSIACLFLGLAVLTKTAPLVLAPLLAYGARRLPAKSLALGAVLVAAPAALGMSIIYVLDPRGITQHVLDYRSIGGYFGISGLADLSGSAEVGRWWEAAFPWLLLAGLSWLTRLLWRKPRLTPTDLVLIAAMTLLALPTLGPGYGPQYIYWYLPLLIAIAAADPGWRKPLVGFYGVAALTYLVEYAMFETHGKFLVRLLPGNPDLARWSAEWSSSSGQTVIRLPIFVGCLMLLTLGGWRLRDCFSRTIVGGHPPIAGGQIVARRFRSSRSPRVVALLVVAAVVWVVLFFVRPTLRSGNGLAAEYYSNATWTGSPVQSVVDDLPSTEQMRARWGRRPPDTFGVTWTGYLTVAGGVYDFSTTSDDGSRLYIDDLLVVDNGGNHSVQTRTGRSPLTRGPHRVRLEYAQAGGDFELAWRWARENAVEGPIARWALSRRPVGYGAVIAARLVDLALWAIPLAIVVVGLWRLAFSPASRASLSGPEPVAPEVSG